MFAKRLERGRFVWPSAGEGKVALTSAQLSMLSERHQLAGTGTDVATLNGSIVSRICNH